MPSQTSPRAACPSVQPALLYAPGGLSQAQRDAESTSDLEARVWASVTRDLKVPLSGTPWQRYAELVCQVGRAETEQARRVKAELALRSDHLLTGGTLYSRQDMEALMGRGELGLPDDGFEPGSLHEDLARKWPDLLQGVLGFGGRGMLNRAGFSIDTTATGRADWNDPRFQVRLTRALPGRTQAIETLEDTPVLAWNAAVTVFREGTWSERIFPPTRPPSPERLARIRAFLEKSTIGT